jgi:hypothetical protein
MPHVIERASSGRAKCRGCGSKIDGGELRFGERLPNPYAADEGGEMTHWYHLACAAYRRPESLLGTLSATAETIDGRGDLEKEAALGAAHRRVPRVNAAERAATGRANCRECHQPIEKGAWRISLVYYEEGRFVPSGFVHATCAATYFETAEILSRLRHFTPALSTEDLAEIDSLLRTPRTPSAESG